jgi:hypothetical protein
MSVEVLEWWDIFALITKLFDDSLDWLDKLGDVIVVGTSLFYILKGVSGRSLDFILFFYILDKLIK